MAVTLTGDTGLFTQIGKLLAILDALNTAQGTTIPTAVSSALTAFNELTVTPELEVTYDGVADAAMSFGRTSILASQVRIAAERLIIHMVNADDPLPSLTIEAALTELIEQMLANSASVDAAGTVSATVSVGANNVTDAALYASAVLADGRTAELAYAETIRLVRQSTTSFNYQGEQAELDSLSPAWPKGSGVSGSLSTLGANLLSNGGFDTENATASDVPQGWDIEDGGSEITLSDVEVQTVVISGDPEGGWYTLTYTDADSNTQTTAPLPYNATGSQVQAALRALDGLGQVTVSTTGTSPNLTHTITFTGVADDVTELTSTDNMTGGTPGIAHNTTTSGEMGFASRALLIDGSAETPTLRQAVTLQPLTTYAWGAWLKKDSDPDAGVLTVELVDGSGTVIADGASANNAATIDLTDSGPLSDSDWVHQGGFFRTPASLPAVVYFRLRISTAMSAGTVLAIDDVRLKLADETYPGGPSLALFPGLVDPVEGDVFEVDVANVREGEFQDWFFRLFQRPEFMLPSDNTGNETIDDALIA